MVGDVTDLVSLAREVQRLADRLRTLSDVRLRQAWSSSQTRAAAVLEVAQALAEVSQGIEERSAVREPCWRVLPDIGVLALGDQVAVAGTDVVVAASGVPADELVWCRSGPQPLGAVVAELGQTVRALRLTL